MIDKNVMKKLMQRELHNPKPATNSFLLISHLDNQCTRASNVES